MTMNTEEAVDWIVRELGADMRVGAPLGLGKPNALLNALYARVKRDPRLSLTLFTALSLDPPAAGSGLRKRFFGPFAERHWGKNYPKLDYVQDAKRGTLPKNVRVHEFYAQAGAYLASPQMQRDYVSVNYTRAAETIQQMGVQLIVQLVAKRGDRYSLSCNPDLTLDVVQLYGDQPIKVLGVVHPDLPFMGGDAEVSAEFFSAIIDSPEHELFALPRAPLDIVDVRIGEHAAALIEDGGTLQVGIGSLSDAVVAALIERHETKPFTEGLYGLSEMVTDGFMHLRRAGILHRTVQDGTFLHGAFFLGSKEFYAWLRDMPEDEARGVRMTRVSKVNDLYDPNECALRRQRVKARFLNTCMQATLLGGNASETLEDGRVVSGVGGQYNFVAMSQELVGSRSVLMLRSTRDTGGKRSSNIVWSHGMLTIPRHLRDTIVTEYGVADLRGKTDEQCIKAMLAITDAEFQAELAELAIEAGKLSHWTPKPENTPAQLAKGRPFNPFPFGSDFTPEEERLALALGKLNAFSKQQQLVAALQGVTVDASRHSRELARVGMQEASSLRDRVTRFALLHALNEVAAARTV